ncbi:beta-arrestin-1-like [Chrysemys picta bellii]
MHPKPKEEPLHRDVPENEAPIDTNLIELDTKSWSLARYDGVRLFPAVMSHLVPGRPGPRRACTEQRRPLSDDDIVFEDFARQRLKGMKDDKEEDEEGTNSPQLNDR